jgi:hypothetical protein
VTEVEWLASEDPLAMLSIRRQWSENGIRIKDGPYFSDRQLRLFACACCRAVWGLLTDKRSRRAVEVAERFADGLAMESEFREMSGTTWTGCCSDPMGSCRRTLEYSASLGLTPAAQAALLRDIVGNPFRRGLTHWDVATAGFLDWNGNVALRLATSIYADRAFDNLPILADALEDAGCTDEGILGHLRKLGPHALGCWALDLILGRE